MVQEVGDECDVVIGAEVGRERVARNRPEARRNPCLLGVLSGHCQHRCPLGRDNLCVRIAEQQTLGGSIIIMI